MDLPAELRVRIYEYTFCDNAADDILAVQGASSHLRRPDSAYTSLRLDPVTAPPRRQIDLLEAKHHYPEASLLSTCTLIYQEAEPIFEAATKAFWDIDIFNVNITGSVQFGYLTRIEFAARMRDLHSRIKSMSLLTSQNLVLQFMLSTESLTMNIKKGGEFGSIYRRGDGVCWYLQFLCHKNAAGEETFDYNDRDTAAAVFEKVIGLVREECRRGEQLTAFGMLDKLFAF